MSDACRGGKRPGAGRPAVLAESEALRIGRACERVWYWLSGPRRPYYWHPIVSLAAAIFYTTKFEKFVSLRRIEFAWKQTRRLGLGRAQPLEAEYKDAGHIEACVSRLATSYDESLTALYDHDFSTSF